MKGAVLPHFVVLCAVAAARADMVHDGLGTFANARILGIVDDELRFQMPDGRTIAKRAADLKWITVSIDHGPASGTLSRAEQEWDKGRLKAAIGLYEVVEKEAERRWMREFSAMRLAMAHDKLGEFVGAIDAYLDLAQRHPLLAKQVAPRNLPPRGSPGARAAIAHIAELQKSPQPADVAVMLRHLARQLAGPSTGRATKKPQPPAATPPPPTVVIPEAPPIRAPEPRPATQPDKPAVAPTSQPTETVANPPAKPFTQPADQAQPTTPRVMDRPNSSPPEAPSRPAEKKMPLRPPVPDTPVMQVRKAIAAGELANATSLLETFRAKSRPGETPLWLVVEAELLHAREDDVGGGLAAMRVVTFYGDSDQVGSALYWAGRCYEGLKRPEKAMQLYGECLQQKRLDESTRRQAEDRLQALAGPHS